jgi:hypothetical protein
VAPWSSRSDSQYCCSIPALWSQVATTAPSPFPKAAIAEAKTWLQERVPLLERDGLDEFTLKAPWSSQSL